MLRTVTSFNKKVNYFLAEEVLSFNMQELFCFQSRTRGYHTIHCRSILFPILSFLRIDEFAVSMLTKLMAIAFETFLFLFHLSFILITVPFLWFSGKIMDIKGLRIIAIKAMFVLSEFHKCSISRIKKS